MKEQSLANLVYFWLHTEKKKNQMKKSDEFSPCFFFSWLLTNKTFQNHFMFNYFIYFTLFYLFFCGETFVVTQRLLRLNTYKASSNKNCTFFFWRAFFDPKNVPPNSLIIIIIIIIILNFQWQNCSIFNNSSIVSLNIMKPRHCTPYYYSPKCFPTIPSEQQGACTMVWEILKMW
jgi:hypothetical protein